VAAEYNVPLHPTFQDLQRQQQQQQQQAAAANGRQAHADASGSNTSSSNSDAEEDGEASSSAAEAAAVKARDAAAAAAAADAEADVLSSYRGDPRPVNMAALAQQARAAAVALVRFGDSIPPARRQQLEGTVAAYVGK
jgi:ribosomal protein S11